MNVIIMARGWIIHALTFMNTFFVLLGPSVCFDIIFCSLPLLIIVV